MVSKLARMYSGRKGKAKSHKPPIKRIPRWMKYRKNKIEELIVNLAKDRHSSAMIGTILRDQYGIPDVKVIVGKTISQIMKENKLYPHMPEDMLNMLRKAVVLREHLAKNKSDKHSKKGLDNLESKIRRLGKYYSREGTLPKEWKYNAEQAKLIVQQK